MPGFESTTRARRTSPGRCVCAQSWTCILAARRCDVCGRFKLFEMNPASPKKYFYYFYSRSPRRERRCSATPTAPNGYLRHSGSKSGRSHRAPAHPQARSELQGFARIRRSEISVGDVVHVDGSRAVCRGVCRGKRVTVDTVRLAESPEADRAELETVLGTMRYAAAAPSALHAQSGHPSADLLVAMR